MTFTSQSIWLTNSLQQLCKSQCLKCRMASKTTTTHNHVCDVSLVGLTCKLGSSRTVIAHTIRLFKLSRPTRQKIYANIPLFMPTMMPDTFGSTIEGITARGPSSTLHMPFSLSATTAVTSFSAMCARIHGQNAGCLRFLDPDLSRNTHDTCTR